MAERVYEDWVVGEEFGPLEYRVTPEAVDLLCDAVDDHRSWYRGESPFGGPVAPSMFGSTDYARLFSSKYPAWGGVLMAKHETEFLAPLKVGKTVRVQGQIVDKYIKRDKPFIVFAYQLVDEDGKTIVRHRQTIMVKEGEGK